MTDHHDWQTRARSPLVPPVVLAVALLAMGALAWGVDQALGLAPWLRAAAAGALIGAGLGLAGWGALTFRRAGTPVRPFQRSTALVTGGPFRFTRNPMYAGMCLVLAGTAAALDSVSAWLVLPVFWWVIDRRFVRHEEVMMRALFGAGYDDYCRRVRRWL